MESYNRFLSWVRSVLAAQLIESRDNILELGHDTAESALEQARKEGDESASFVCADHSAVSLEGMLPFTSPVDVVVSFGGLHSAFESIDSLRIFIGNVSRDLRNGGYFTGLSLDPTETWTKWQKLVERKAIGPGGLIRWVDKEKLFELELGVSNVEFEMKPVGTPFNLQIGDVSESGFVPNFSTLIEVAAQEGLRLVSVNNLSEFYGVFKKHYEASLASMEVFDKDKKRITVMGLICMSANCTKLIVL